MRSKPRDVRIRRWRPRWHVVAQTFLGRDWRSHEKIHHSTCLQFLHSCRSHHLLDLQHVCFPHRSLCYRASQLRGCRDWIHPPKQFIFDRATRGRSSVQRIRYWLYLEVRYPEVHSLWEQVSEKQATYRHFDRDEYARRSSRTCQRLERHSTHWRRRDIRV
ncbi:uncharacterized protein PV09_02014 [Verruconis gallopava]|uniref:Uncharacterized protein n=1 Tax=Verruconis gallopava TaxID=253628 RepID=A0A0D2AJV6_9PEZI|nr:uncharacterized protein PV09_02014 [Verruconis gallopava]KIW07143.1 hypothetical protein PV09_02014 [Verruconis gallopava]